MNANVAESGTRPVDAALAAPRPAAFGLDLPGGGDGKAAVATIRELAAQGASPDEAAMKSVVELAVHRNDKGGALDTLAEERSPASIVYLGDDEPDEAAFDAVNRLPIRSVSVRVGHRDGTAATHTLSDASAVPELLTALTFR